jgi:hypothetical protein
MSKYNAMEETYEPVNLFGKPALFTNLRLDRSTLPEGLYVYDIRSSSKGRAAAIEPYVTIDHLGTVIASEAIDFGKKDHIQIDGERMVLNFAADHDCTTVTDYQHYLSKRQEE